MEIYIVVFTSVDDSVPPRIKSRAYAFKSLEDAKRSVAEGFWWHYMMLSPIVREYIKPENVDLEKEAATLLGKCFRSCWKIYKEVI